ncbi:unnamed protein product [Pleuronectes platessa]|uniref:Uncharacterized protein n=1 Tax=Pleuronectes platessa TaxID=8262 RepID=A0A9N7Y8R4_PLEPL|nr:unnamed protein product [Pleuronectes platessa]
MKILGPAKGQDRALCETLWVYDAACKEAGGMTDLWTNTTGCAYQCSQFSLYSQCANVCSSLCPEISMAQCVKNGTRFKASESKLLQNCTVNYTCGPPVVSQIPDPFE